MIDYPTRFIDRYPLLGLKQAEKARRQAEEARDLEWQLRMTAFDNQHEAWVTAFDKKTLLSSG